MRPVPAAAPATPAAPAVVTAENGDDTKTVLPDPNVKPRKPGYPPIPKRRLQLGVVVHASAKAWIKITDRNNVTIWQGTLQPGGRYKLPGNALAPVIRSGNAGKTYVLVNGVPHGPLGAKGTIARNIPLSVERIRADLPIAQASALAAEGSAPTASADARRNRP